MGSASFKSFFDLLGMNTFRKEFNKLLIHGLSHLFGYEHKKDKDYYIMKKVEKKFLSYLK